MFKCIERRKLAGFERFIKSGDKSEATTEKYLHDVRVFFRFLSKVSKNKSFINSLTSEKISEYKDYLKNNYASSSINSMLAALNQFLKFLGLENLCVQLIKVQKRMFLEEDRELSKEEYNRLLKAAEGTRLYYILDVIAGTGIRISELEYITVEAVKEGKAVVTCKNKTRVIFIPKPVQRRLLEYIKRMGIKSGPVFVTKNGNPLNRSNIWRDMKALCKKANVSESKVFPHNLRHLFARLFYTVEKDIVRLADLLGHTSIDTTRIYTAESGNLHRLALERVQKKLTT